MGGGFESKTTCTAEAGIETWWARGVWLCSPSFSWGFASRPLYLRCISGRIRQFIVASPHSMMRYKSSKSPLIPMHEQRIRHGLKLHLPRLLATLTVSCSFAKVTQKMYTIVYIFCATFANLHSMMSVGMSLGTCSFNPCQICCSCIGMRGDFDVLDLIILCGLCAVFHARFVVRVLA